MDDTAKTVTTAAKQVFKLPFLVKLFLGILIFNFGLDLIAAFLPPIAGSFLTRPFTTLRNLIANKTAGGSS